MERNEIRVPSPDQRNRNITAPPPLPPVLFLWASCFSSKVEIQALPTRLWPGQLLECKGSPSSTCVYQIQTIFHIPSLRSSGAPMTRASEQIPLRRSRKLWPGPPF